MSDCPVLRPSVKSGVGLKGVDRSIDYPSASLLAAAAAAQVMILNTFVGATRRKGELIITRPTAASLRTGWQCGSSSFGQNYSCHQGKCNKIYYVEQLNKTSHCRPVVKVSGGTAVEEDVGRARLRG